MAGEGDARSSAEMAVKHVSWSKVCAVAALANTGPAGLINPADPRYRPVERTPNLFSCLSVNWRQDHVHVIDASALSAAAPSLPAA